MAESNTEAFSSKAEEQRCVLVGIDFSEDSRAATLWACEYATMSGAPLVLLHVVHDPATEPGFYAAIARKDMQPMTDAAESMMTEFTETLKAAHPDNTVLDNAATHLVPGLPPSRIIEVARLLNASLVVIGSRGLTGWSHIMLGSVADRVVKLSDRPVVVVKSDNCDVGKKERKRERKLQKKERKRLQQILGLKDRKPEKTD